MVHQKWSSKLLKILLAFLIVVIFMLFIFTFMKPVVSSYLSNMIDGKVYYSDDNIAQWGNFTDDGTIKVYTKVRYYSMNAESKVASPTTVQELPEVVFKSMYKAYNVTYLDDKDKVGYTREVSFLPEIPTKKFNAQMINFLGVIFWHRVKTIAIEDMAFSAIASITTGIGLGIEKQLRVAFLFKVFDKLGEYVTRFFLTKNLSISSQTAHLMMEDPYFGFRRQNGLMQWLDTYSDDEKQKEISDYFNIDKSQVLKAMSNLHNIIKMAEEYIKYEVFCNDDCDPYNLLVRQWSNSEISKPLLKKLTLADKETLFGLPEYNAFYMQKFATKPGFEDCAMSINQAKVLLNINLKDLDYSRNWNNLIHKGNIYDIFIYGKKYDETKDESSLEPLVSRFGLKNIRQAVVLYEYLKYLGDEFITSKQYGGNIEIATLTALYTEYAKNLFIDVTEFFKKDFLPYFFTQWGLKQHNESCQRIFKASIDNLSDDEVSAICKPYTDQTLLFTALYSYCELNDLSFFKLTDKQSEQLCRTPNDKVASYDLIKSTMKNMVQFYFGASDPVNLAISQFVEGKITQQDSPYTSDRYPQSDSLFNWDKKRFRTRFELLVIAKDNNIDPSNINLYTKERFKPLLNDVRLFSQPVVNMAIIRNRKKDNTYFDKFFGLKNPGFFELYVKEFVRSFVLGGKFISINEQEAINGIPLQIFSDLKRKPVILGGDPSIDEAFNIIKPALGYTIKHTGKSNIKELDNFEIFNNLNTSSVPMPSFNGNQTTINYVQPWKKELPVTGCELFCEPYDKDESSLNPSNKRYKDLKNKHIEYYQDTLARNLRLKYNSTRSVKDHGFVLNKFKVDNDQLLANEANDDYFQYKYNGAFNMTSIVGGPFFMTKNRFLDAEVSVRDKINILDEDGQPAAPRTDIDDIFFETEQFTNACTTNNVNLQLNLRVEENEMFKYNDDPDILYPIINIYGYQNISDDFLATKFEELLPIYKTVDYYFIYLFILLAVFVVLALGTWYCIQKVNYEDNEAYIEEGQHAENLLNN